MRLNTRIWIEIEGNKEILYCEEPQPETDIFGNDFLPTLHHPCHCPLSNIYLINIPFLIGFDFSLIILGKDGHSTFPDLLYISTFVDHDNGSVTQLSGTNTKRYLSLYSLYKVGGQLTIFLNIETASLNVIILILRGYNLLYH